MLSGLHRRLTRAYGRFWSSETAVMLTMALLVGLGSGFGAVAFRALIDLVQTFFGSLADGLIDLRVPVWLVPYVTVLAPALGGLGVGLMAQVIAPEVRGPGVSSVMEALALQGGRMRAVIIAAKPVATSLTVGSGGSAGREGPIVQIGSAIGSALSQLTGLSDERRKNLVACGAAGGIAATFNAPLAGVMFALEVLLAEFRLIQFTSVVVAAVIASVVGHTYFGDVPAFSFPPSAPPVATELPIYAALGIAAALLGVAFIRILTYVEGFFAERSLPVYAKPALGGLAVGLIGLWFPRVLGVGYDSIEAVLLGQLTLISLVALALLKVVATSLTVGSGGAGGIFAPSLFIGAMLGGLFGELIQRATPSPSVPSAYALVGMSAVFAAVSRAPITAILTLFEMTRDYNIMLPLMLASVVSAIVARSLLEDSIYTARLTRRGIDVRAERKLDLMSGMLVGEAMTPIDEMTTVKPATPLAELARIFDETHYHGLVVVDDRCRLKGVVSLSDLEQAQTQQLLGGEVADIHTTKVRTVFPDQSLKAALQYFDALDVGRIPVVERGDPRQVIGILRRGDIVRAYAHAAMDRQARLAGLDRARLERGTQPDTSARVLEVRLQERHQAVGKTIQDLDLPSGSLIASIRRGNQVLIPRGNTRLQAGDVVVALVTDQEQRTFESRLTGPGKYR
jgi:CIC family chloride channel protein